MFSDKRCIAIEVLIEMDFFLGRTNQRAFMEYQLLMATQGIKLNIKRKDGVWRIFEEGQEEDRQIDFIDENISPLRRN